VLENSFNIIHGSGEPETTVQEINLIFKPEELVNYSLDTDEWAYKQK
jgi:nucleoside-diphosphate kinase